MDNIYKKHFKRFFSHRNKLIENLDNKEIDKKDFIKENYELIYKIDMKPFANPNNYEKCMYNYQYYNILAKYFYNLSKKKGVNVKKQKLYKDKSRNYYNEKDKSIKNIIKILDKNDIEAYYVKSISKKLNEKLVEIHIKSFEKSILHTLNNEIINSLKEKGVFEDEIRKSIIDEYINMDY